MTVECKSWGGGQPIYSPSTMCPTRRSIMEGTGSPSSAGAALAPPFFPPCSLLPPALDSASLFFSFFSFFCVFSAGCAGEGSALDLAAALVLSSVGALGAFSFFFEGSGFRSNFGAFSRSKKTCLKASPSDSADVRTNGRD